MRIFLETSSPPSKAVRIEALAGQNIRIGREQSDGFAFPEDSFMSRAHFELIWLGAACYLKDLGSGNGTFLNGERIIASAILKDGDRIRAGQTEFLVRLEQLPQPQQGLLPLLRQSEPLFALLDAAREPDIPELLKASGEQFQSLYSGEKGEELAPFGPFLVALPPQSVLLKRLVEDGWGKSWAIYLTCQEQFDQVRKHFRHFLMVELKNGQQAYFRFYDPRVMRAFLPTCSSEETNQLFGPVTCYLMEAAQPDSLLQFTNSGQGVSQLTLPLLVSHEVAA